MIDPDNPKLQDVGNDSIHFERAYWQVMEQVEVSTEAVAALLPLLHDAYKAGESVKTTLRNVRKWLPDGTWCWPEYERQLSLKIDESHDMLQMLVIRINRLASGYERWQQIHEEEKFSYLKLSVFDPAKARPQCLAIEGKALRLNNPYWKDNFPPCERLDCRCWVTAKTERGVERDNLEIIDKI